jgi:ribosome biogenesis GTPase / thiamine phosphate phosphatase
MKGRVMKSTGSWYEVLSPEGGLLMCRTRGKLRLKGTKTNNPIAVGDWVEYLPEDTNGVITDIYPRDNYLVRKSVHKTAHSHVLAANIDQAVLIATLVYPRTSLGFIDRFLVSAEAYHIPQVIVFNKIDLLEDEGLAHLEEVIAIYENLGVQCLKTSVVEGLGLEALGSLLQGKTSLLSGHSGVGKSSLLNRIAPQISQKTGAVSNFAQKGIHTTTFAEMFLIADDTFIIDTPGIKELGLVDIQGAELADYFPEMAELQGHCKFYNCTHVHEPSCAIRDAVEAGTIAPSRYHSYLGMLGDEDNRR